jgi:hypothetical protein
VGSARPVERCSKPEAVQQARAVVLVQQQVGQLRDPHAQRPGSVAVHAERGLLGHHSAGEHRGGLLAQQGCDLLLEPGDGAALGVHVPLLDAELRGVPRDVVHRLPGRPARGPEDVLLTLSRDLAEALDHVVHVNILVPGGTPSSTASTSSWRAVRATRCG